MKLTAWLRCRFLHECEVPRGAGVRRAERRLTETEQLATKTTDVVAALRREARATTQGNFLEAVAFPPRTDGPPTAPRGTVRKRRRQ